MSRKNEKSSTQNSQENNDSFLGRGLHRWIPDWQRSRSQNQPTSDSDIDTLGNVVLPDNIEPATTPKSAPLTRDKNRGRASGKKQESQWWSGQSKPNQFKNGQHQDPVSGLSLNSNDSELEVSTLTGGRRYKLLLALSGLFLVVALGLGFKSYRDGQEFRIEKQNLNETSLEVSSLLNAFNANSNTMNFSEDHLLSDKYLNIIPPSNTLLSMYPVLSQNWVNWDKTQEQYASHFKSIQSYQGNINQIGNALNSGWKQANQFWMQAGQAGQWNNQVLLSQALNNMMMLSHLMLDNPSNKSFFEEASSFEKTITQSLQETESLNNDTSLIGQTWKTMAQIWIANRPNLLKVIAQASNQNQIWSEQKLLKTQTMDLKNALRNTLQQIDDKSSSVSSNLVLAFGLLIASIVLLVLALILQGRQARFYALNARHDLVKQFQGLEQIKEVLSDIKKGHWQTRLPVKTGIVGDISHEINNVLDASSKVTLSRTQELKELAFRLEKIQTETGELTDKSNQLIDVLAQSGTTLLGLEEKTEQLEKQSISIDQTISKSKAMEQNGGDSVQDISKNMSDLQLRIQEVLGSIGNLSETSKQIDSCIESLSHLAARAEVLSIQTDLRAVQSQEGEPFRLVAKEMHNLAEENEGLVKRIGSLSESLIRETQVALEGIQKANQNTESTARLADLTDDAWRQLSSYCAHMIEVVEKMKDASLNQAQVVNELSEYTQQGLTLLQDMNKQSVNANGVAHETLNVCQTSLSNLNQSNLNQKAS